MGRSALVSHMKGKEHASLANANNKSDKNSLFSFVSKGKNEPTPSTSTSTVPQSSITSNSVDSFLSDSSSLQYEICLCVSTAMSNYSAYSNGDIDFYVKQIFPHVQAVQKLSCGSAKSK